MNRSQVVIFFVVLGLVITFTNLAFYWSVLQKKNTNTDGGTQTDSGGGAGGAKENGEHIVGDGVALNDPAAENGKHDEGAANHNAEGDASKHHGGAHHHGRKNAGPGHHKHNQPAAHHKQQHHHRHQGGAVNGDVPAVPDMPENLKRAAKKAAYKEKMKKLKAAQGEHHHGGHAHHGGHHAGAGGKPVAEEKAKGQDQDAEKKPAHHYAGHQHGQPAGHHHGEHGHGAGAQDADAAQKAGQHHAGAHHHKPATGDGDEHKAPHAEGEEAGAPTHHHHHHHHRAVKEEGGTGDNNKPEGDGGKNNKDDGGDAAVAAGGDAAKKHQHHHKGHHQHQHGDANGANAENGEEKKGKVHGDKAAEGIEKPPKLIHHGHAHNHGKSGKNTHHHHHHHNGAQGNSSADHATSNAQADANAAGGDGANHVNDAEQKGADAHSIGGGGGHAVQKFGPRKSEKHVKDEAFHVPAKGFAPISFIKAVRSFDKYISNPPPPDLEQSSRSFKDILEHSNAGVRLPDIPAVVPPALAEGLSYDAPAILATTDGDVAFDATGVEKKSPAAGVAEGGDQKGNGVKTEEDEKAAQQKKGRLLRPMCDPRQAKFNPELDKQCVAYLQDTGNWLSVKVMSSILQTGRTIKMKVTFKDGRSTAVMKIAQKKFLLEPTSEFVSYTVDRILKFNRVPPTAWVKVPAAYLHAAAAEAGEFYSHWFHQFTEIYPDARAAKCHCDANPLFDGTVSGKTNVDQNAGTNQGGGSGAIVGGAGDGPVGAGENANQNQDQNAEMEKPFDHPRSGEKSHCVYVSVQLWMADVHNADESALVTPSHHRQLLDAGAAWNPKEFGPHHEKENADTAEEGNGDRNTGRSGASNAGQLQGTDGKDKTEKSKNDKTPWIGNVSLAEISDVGLFDYVIGNTDRWFGHNSFVYGGCDRTDFSGRQPRCTAPNDNTHRTALAYPTFAYIDQGSSFYRRPAPDMNLYKQAAGDGSSTSAKHKKGKHDHAPQPETAAEKEKEAAEKESPEALKKRRTSLCRMRERTAKTLLKWAEPQADFFWAVKQRLPKGVFALGNPSLVKAGRSRLRELGAMVQACVDRFGEESTFFFKF